MSDWTSTVKQMNVTAEFEWSAGAFTAVSPGIGTIHVNPSLLYGAIARTNVKGILEERVLLDESDSAQKAIARHVDEQGTHLELRQSVNDYKDFLLSSLAGQLGAALGHIYLDVAGLPFSMHWENMKPAASPRVPTSRQPDFAHTAGVDLAALESKGSIKARRSNLIATTQKGFEAQVEPFLGQPGNGQTVRRGFAVGAWCPVAAPSEVIVCRDAVTTAVAPSPAVPPDPGEDADDGGSSGPDATSCLVQHFQSVLRLMGLPGHALALQNREPFPEGAPLVFDDFLGQRWVSAGVTPATPVRSRFSLHEPIYSALGAWLSAGGEEPLTLESVNWQEGFVSELFGMGFGAFRDGMLVLPKTERDEGSRTRYGIPVSGYTPVVLGQEYLAPGELR